MKKKNNLLIFAHYDKDNIIEDYVLYYLKELRKICTKIIFISDCNLPEEEISKLENIADFAFSKNHGEYDFGSYKIGLKYAEENDLLTSADNLLLINDSCYGPFQALEKIYETMEQKSCDFWGITDNQNYIDGEFISCEKSKDKHIQSYFIVLKKQIFNTEEFKNFLYNVQIETDKNNIIKKYEIGLSKFLCEKGFVYEVFENTNIRDLNIYDLANPLKKEPFVFLKCSMMKEFKSTRIFNRKLKTIEQSQMIEKHLCRFFKTKNNNIFEQIYRIVLFLNYFRKCYIKVHLNEKRIFLFGKWHSFEN